MHKRVTSLKESKEKQRIGLSKNLKVPTSLSTLKSHKRIYSDFVFLPKMKTFQVKSKKIQSNRPFVPSKSSRTLNIKFVKTMGKQDSSPVLNNFIQRNMSPIKFAEKTMENGLNTNGNKLDDTIKEMLAIITFGKTLHD